MTVRARPTDPAPIGAGVITTVSPGFKLSRT